MHEKQNYVHSGTLFFHFLACYFHVFVPTKVKDHFNICLDKNLLGR
jgi:hypothetical protein